MADSSNPNITNIIVVLLENRSYDNILGALYSENNQPPYVTPPQGQSGLNGLNGNESNPSTSLGTLTVANQTSSTQIYGGGVSISATTIPIIDPGEPFNDMAQQITGSSSKVTSNPYTVWPPATQPEQNALMQGFVYNYETKASDSNLQDVMNYFTPAQLPVSAYLANQYCVCDNWFASLPTQTFSNRVFAFCAAPGVSSLSGYHSLVDDEQYITDQDFFTELPSVFQALDINCPPTNNNSPNWKLYFHDYSISIMTTPYVYQAANSDNNVNISTFDQSDWGGSTPEQLKNTTSTFMDDITNGTLPPFSFIESRYSNTYAPKRGGVSPAPAVNSNHPGSATYPSIAHPFPKVDEDNPAIDVSSGELFLMQLYNTLRNSAYWDNSLLIVTYDEHGGIYDSVPPLAAQSPGTINWLEDKQPFTNLPDASNMADKTADGFSFNVYGGRVPAIIISPFVEQGSTLTSSNNIPFDHASIVKTVLNNLVPSVGSLTERDAAAPNVTDSANISTANQNNAAPFSGVIVPAPSSIVFHLHALDDSSEQLLQASAGNTSLSATTSASWLSLQCTTDNTLAGSVISIIITADKSGLKSGTYTSDVSISGSGVTTINIPITLVVSFF